MTTNIETVSFSWEQPIEQELLKWCRYMKRQNEQYIAHTIWGRKQKQEAEIYICVFEMVEAKILREIEIRTSHEKDTNAI